MRLRKIVAAVDETPAGVHALRAAALIADAADAKLVALRVITDPWRCVRPEEIEPLRMHGDRAPVDLAEARCLTELRDVIRETIGDARATAIVRFGIPSIELAQGARREGADLLVLGRQPSGDFERRPADRTIGGTLQQGTVPALIVPFGQRTWRTVLAVVDETETRRVDAVARAFADLWRAPVRRLVVQAAGVGARAGPSPAWTAEPQRDEIADGASPAGAVLKLAHDEGVETIVVGYADHERGAQPADVVWRLVQRAHCSVLAVPVDIPSESAPRPAAARRSV